MSLVPMVRVPLNIMCSNRWLIPVMPSRSFTEPTWATHPADTVGESWRSKRSQRMPLGRVNSSTAMPALSASAAQRGAGEQDGAEKRARDGARPGGDVHGFEPSSSVQKAG